MRTILRRWVLPLVPAAVVLATLAAASAARAMEEPGLTPAAECNTPVGSPTVVMCGLHNPRGLAFGPQGALYVAEAGRGGQGPCFTPGAIQFCYGPSGAVSRLWGGAQDQVATGLASFAEVGNPTIPDGTRAEGPNDIALLGVGDAHVTIGLESNPDLRDLSPDLAGLGQLVRVSASGQWRSVADLAAFEQENNPDDALYGGDCHSGLPDSNPYGLLAEPAGLIVADAGGNDLLRVGANGDISLLAVMPPVPAANDCSAVPTSIALGPDGAYYVGELTGAPFRNGAASVYRLVPGEEPQVLQPGFKAIIDIAFDQDGSLYVLQHATGPTMLTGAGVLIRVAPDGTRTAVLTGLDRPTSVAVGPDDALYVTNHGLSASGGEVLRIQP